MSRYMTADDVSDAFADERRALAAEYEGEIAELRAEVADLRERLAGAEVTAYERGCADTNTYLAPLRVIADALLDRVLEPIAKREENLLTGVARVSLYVEPAKADVVVATLRHMSNVTGMHLDAIPSLEPLRPLLNVLHAELLRSDRVEHYPQGDDAPAMLKIGRATLFGIAADPLLEALRSACLDFTDDKED